MRGIDGRKKRVGLCIIVTIIVAIVLLAGIMLKLEPNGGDSQALGPFGGIITSGPKELKTFHSFSEMYTFLETNRNLSMGSYHSGAALTLMSVSSSSEGSSYGTQNDQYSTTNVQVEGVDEGDILKNDNDHAYLVSTSMNSFYIVNVSSAESARVVKESFYNGTIDELYLAHGKLLVVWSERQSMYYYDRYLHPNVSLDVYLLEDKENPILERRYKLTGGYEASRVIGNYFYYIGKDYAYSINESNLPVPPEEILYVDEYDNPYTLTSFTAVNLANTNMEPNIKSILLGYSSNIYVSSNNIYIAHRTRMSPIEKEEVFINRVYLDIVPDELRTTISIIMCGPGERWDKVREVETAVSRYYVNRSYLETQAFYYRLQQERNNFNNLMDNWHTGTLIYRVSVIGKDVDYAAHGFVRGDVLNRFSMDEYENHFRIATTSGQSSRSGTSTVKNNVYILNMNLEVIGQVEGIAPGETIYSARFVGNRGYLVTFKKIDPFFAMDLSDPQNPKVLGELKIPGFSNYLHPYSDTSIIGLGKDAADMGDFAWFQGVKLFLFNVTNVDSPTELSNITIGDRGTNSLALTEPHAFLLNKADGLLIIPIDLALVNQSHYNGTPPPNAYGEYASSGIYVFTINETTGIALRGSVTHFEVANSSYSHNTYNNPYQVTRAFYIDDTLYSVSGQLIKVNKLNNLTSVNTIYLP
ncbi:MAG: beta-propeller domain-containing protein [Euryarchaeota archaeon]|nr:beta-propeller domain-containing protein [Euryarchaeota archaeon]